MTQYSFTRGTKIYLHCLDKSSRDFALISSEVSSNSLAPFHSSRLIDLTIRLLLSVVASPLLPPFGALLEKKYNC